MKPKRIILVRHGESEANVERTKYESTPDYALDLTDTGRAQAIRAGEEIRGIIGEETIHAYVSPFYRTRQTFEEIANVLGDSGPSTTRHARARSLGRHRGRRTRKPPPPPGRT